MSLAVSGLQTAGWTLLHIGPDGAPGLVSIYELQMTVLAISFLQIPAHTELLAPLSAW